ncbi:MAG: glycosyltransferase family 39 protein [Chloroflexi bacterium]|nr:glycosyltransferase family 39 protein [Chloroflexota bacterium]
MKLRLVSSSVAGEQLSPIAKDPSWRWAIFTWCGLALCVVAFGLRLFKLGNQSLWYDEALSYSIATLPLPRIVTHLARVDVHPPLYFVLLHFWVLGAGRSETSLRLLSAVAGTGAVAGVTVLGKRLGGMAVGLVSGVLACFSPFLVYYSQEVRMYALLLLTSTIAGYALWRAMQGEARWWRVYILAAAAMLWTHLTGILIFIAFNVWCCSSWIVQIIRGRQCLSTVSASAAGVPLGTHLRQWMMAQLFVILLFAPWVPVLVTKVAHPAGGFVHGTSAGWILEQTAVVFSLGHMVVGINSFPGTNGFSAEDQLAHRLILPFLFALSVGSVVRRERFGFLGPWLLLPIIGFILLSLHVPRGFNARYFIAMFPAFTVILASGIAALWGRRRTALLGAFTTISIVVITLFTLNRLYFDPQYARDNDRGAVAFIRTESVPGAAVVLDADFQPVFRYYAGNRWPVANIPATVPAQRSIVSAALARFTHHRPQVWLVLWHDYWSDPHAMVWYWLARHFYEADWVNFHGGIKVLRFNALPAQVQTVHATTFAGVAHLTAVAVHVRPSAKSSGVNELVCDLYWRDVHRTPQSYITALHVIDPAGRVYGSAIAAPGDGHTTTNGWIPGGLYQTSLYVPLLPWTAPGTYRLQVQWYDPVTRAPVPLAGLPTQETSVMVPISLSLMRSPQSVNPLPTRVAPVNARIGGAQLAGYMMTREGQKLLVTLFWRDFQQFATDDKVFVHALDQEGKLVATGDSSPVGGALPFTLWFPGETIRDPHDIIIPPGAVVKRIDVGLYDPHTGNRLPAYTATGAVLPRDAVSLSLNHLGSYAS